MLNDSMCTHDPGSDKILKTDSITRSSYLRCFAFDERSINMYPACFILNTQPRSEEGEHWLTFFFDRHENCYFFDSFGNKPSFYGLNNYVLANSKKWTFNLKQLQGFEPHCGVYCIFFLLFITRGKLENLLITVSKMIKYLLKH